MMPPQVKTIAKMIEACRHRHDLYTLFADCCETMAIALSNATDLAQREAREARYLEIVKRYDRPVVETFPRILGEVVEALEAGPFDVLGAVFHALELHNKHRGQFFTPYELCRLLARMSIGSTAELREQIAARGFITANEPACGAGAMVIALAEAMRDSEINYQQHLHVTAVDVDSRAVHMAYVQLTLLHVPAVVVVGNTITLEEREHWYTPAHVLGGWSRRLRTAAPERSAVLSIPATGRTEQDRPTSPVSADAAPTARKRPAEAQLTLF